MVVSFMVLVLHDPDRPEAESRHPPRRRPARRGRRPEGPGGYDERIFPSEGVRRGGADCRRVLPTPPFTDTSRGDFL